MECGIFWNSVSKLLRLMSNIKSSETLLMFDQSWLLLGNFRSIGILLPKLFWPTVRKNCTIDREKILKFEAEGWEFAKILRSQQQFVQTVKGQNNVWYEQHAFLTCSWRCLRSNKSEQLHFKLENSIGIQKTCRKS